MKTLFSPSSFSTKSVSFSFISHIFKNLSSFTEKPISPLMTPTGAATNRRQKKVIVIMGPTGSGKSKLSIDLATRFFPNMEIINSDKIQVYRGLDITTNKITTIESRGVPHHFLGEFDPDTEFTPTDFRSLGSLTISQITSCKKLPLIVGGSNSFIYSILAKSYNPKTDVFDESKGINSVCMDLRYNCCFLWVDVSLPVLNQYLSNRVEEMLDSGMFEELADYFESKRYVDSDLMSPIGLMKAIGVPEFERYFKRYGKSSRNNADTEERVLYEEAVKAIKENTCQLAKRQLRKIQRLRNAGWDIQKIDATEAFRAVMMMSVSGRRVSEIWEKQVVEPSVKIVKQLLMG